MNIDFKTGRNFLLIILAASIGMLSPPAQAQSDRWLQITGADTLREKISGLKAERMLKGGEISRGEYFADGTGVVHEYGASFARTWEIRGDDQLCIAAAKVALCYTFEQNADDPTLYRVKDVDTGKITEFNVLDGKGVVKGDVKEVDARGSAATPSAAEIAAELANPNTPMATLTFKVQQRSFEGTLPDANNQDSTTLLLQPSLPFPLENGDLILFRPAIPLLIDQPVFNAADSGSEVNTY